MNEYGFVRCGASTPKLKVADPIFNTEEIKKIIDQAIENKIDIITFPELSITGYTCGDLFFQDILIDTAYQCLQELVLFSNHKDIVFIIGMPIRADNKLFNTAVVINQGNILGIVPKTYLPNYQEFYEKRWFNSSLELTSTEIELCHQTVAIGANLLFKEKHHNVCFGIDICEDLWAVNPPSNDYAQEGANLLFNLSASNETIAKNEYRHDLIKIQSAKLISGYIYASSGVNESSQDILFSGASMIYENGTLLKENKHFDFESNFIYADIDILKLTNDRIKNTSFISKPNNRKITFELKEKNRTLERTYMKTPFVPMDYLKRNQRCQEIITIQSSALAKRLLHTGMQKCVLGVSGGLDSTLAFLVILEAYRKLEIDNRNLIAVTLPGFGTTDRTYQNAIQLMKENHVTILEIDIKEACILHYKDIDWDINNHDITYENVQARERTQILMDIANKENALVIGTGDLSELALGWCTYNGDHMSMYAVNTSIPKTLVKYLVKYEADRTNSKVLHDIVATPISPELLPSDQNKMKQKTEDLIGPYLLHDFFLYHFLRYGATPKKIYAIAVLTFKEYSEEEILTWLKVFLKRFFTSQFKRSCMPDGVKVGSISVSPRGDLRMPSDAVYHAWMKDLEGVTTHE